jgi:beta-glucosidase/6-phospho-beta-glucosidase/beta-galactosidase
VQEEKAGIMEKALAKVSADLNGERTKAEATQKEYNDKMEDHTARAKHSLNLDKVLEEKKVELDWRERDLELHEATLAEAQT